MNDEARVEAAARAMFVAATSRGRIQFPWDDPDLEQTREMYRRQARAALAAVDAHDEKEGDLREWVVRCARNCRNLSRIWHETGDDTTADAFLAIALGAERVSGTTQEGTGEA